MKPAVEAFRTQGGARVYRLPLDLFPMLQGFAHLVCTQEVTALVDVGSGFGESNEQLQAGLQAVKRGYGEPVSWQNLTHIIITHGHIDHFGGLPFVRARTAARVGIHELDLRVLANYEERLSVVARRLRAFLVETGLEEGAREELMTLYLLNKHLFSSVTPDFTFEAVDMQVGDLKLFHVPGHCPGQVVVRVDDLLLSSDHVLADVSPHQAPERLTLNTGLGHYLESLRRLFPFAQGIHCALGGHGGVIEDLPARCAATQRLHARRLDQVLALISKPVTVAQVAEALFPGVEDYDRLLALEEAAAHIEYLHQRGYLYIENLHDLDQDVPMPIRYGRLAGTEELLPRFSLPCSERSSATVDT